MLGAGFWEQIFENSKAGSQKLTANECNPELETSISFCCIYIMSDLPILSPFCKAFTIMPRLLLFAFLFLVVSCARPQQSGQEHVNDLSFKDCDSSDGSMACHFLGMPENLSAELTITTNTKNRPLTISGKVLDAATEKPIADAIIYLYHTDETGRYTKNGDEKGIQKWHGAHYGWLKTDKDGYYAFHTLKPAPYPNANIPAHIHPVIKMPDGKMFFLNDFVFADDPYVTPDYIQNLTNDHNPSYIDNGVVELKNVNGQFIGQRDIYIKK